MLHTLAHWFIGRPLTILIILLVTFVVRGLLVRISNRFISRVTSLNASKRISKISQQDFETAQQNKDRRATSLSQLFRSIITIVVWSISVVTMLSYIGINVTPILTSASVVGVAVGFGAQTLVKDYLAGISMIIEDQYSVGDVIDVGALTGTVTEVGLRITRLKDDQGVIWYVRNGEIARIGNHSQKM